MAVVAAIVGYLIACATVIYGNRIANRGFRYLALVAGIICALGAMGVLASDPQEGSLAGQIFAGLIVLTYVVKSLFLRKKKSD